VFKLAGSISIVYVPVCDSDTTPVAMLL